MFSFIFLIVTYFGGTLDPATTNVPSNARLIPIAEGVFRMVQPDGQKKIFQVVDADEGILLGPRPWVGKMAKGRVDIWSDPEKTGGKLRTGYTFVNGQLRMMQADGVTYKFPGGVPKLEGGDLVSLFPKIKARSFEKGSAGDIWQGDKARLRLWFANPNSTGMFFAQLVLLFAALAVRFSRYPLALGLGAALSAASALGLLKTGSRGALLATFLGFAFLMWPYFRRLCTKRGLVVLCATILLMVGGAFATGQARRLGGTFTSVDAGNSLRLKVARAAVQMFADAPGGWQSGEVPARHACLNWYVFDETHTLRTHVLTLAELGWVKGFCYVAFWCLLLGLGVAALWRRSTEPLAFSASLALAGCLNPVYREGVLWILPSVSVVWACLSLRGTSRRVWILFLSCVGCVSFLTITGLILVGRALQRPTAVPVHAVAAATLVNGEKPSVWVVEDVAVLGGLGFPGREILSYYQHHMTAPALGFVREIDDLPRSVETLVLPGRAAAEFLDRFTETGEMPCRARRILFLSPSVGPDVVPAELFAQAEIKWRIGNFAAMKMGTMYGEVRDWVSIRVGCELYIPNWLEEAFSWK